MSLAVSEPCPVDCEAWLQILIAATRATGPFGPLAADDALPETPIPGVRDLSHPGLVISIWARRPSGSRSIL